MTDMDQDKQKEDLLKKDNKKRKLLPAFIMLSAGAIVSIYTFFQGYEMGKWLVTLFATMVLFLFLGLVFEWMLEYFDKVNTEREEEEQIRIIEEAAEQAEEEAETDAATDHFDVPET